MSRTDQTQWLDPPTAIALSPGTIHLWRVGDEIAASTLADLAGALSPEELRRAEQYRFENDRRRFVLCRGILRELLGRYLNTPPQDIQFARGPHGKPTLAAQYHSKLGLEFNLSHTNGLALFGFAAGHAIGVDVEAIDAHRDWAPLAKRFLHPNEWQIISTLPVERRADAFHTCWTCKEAYLKARGEGLMRGLATFDVVPPADRTGTAVLNDPSEPNAANWWLHELDLAPGFAGAVASARHPAELHCFRYGASI